MNDTQERTSMDAATNGASGATASAPRKAQAAWNGLAKVALAGIAYGGYTALFRKLTILIPPGIVWALGALHIVRW